MSEWTWVALGFGIAYGATGGYLLVLRRRLATARRRLEQPR